MKSNNRGAIIAWALACAACVAIFFDAFNTWFLMDDFAWLGLRQEIASPGNGWRLLFEPRAQGTVRLFSERLYFVLISGIFGVDPLPFRICAFAVQFANLWMLVRLAMRFTAGSAVAGFASAFFYACSARMVKPLVWASSFNQILAACCMLAAFTLFLDWIETGRARYWWGQLAVFLLSFGVLESVIVYPALVTLYALLFARRHALRTLTLWIPSAAFAVWHLFFIQRPANTPYSPILDEGMFASLANYTWIALGPSQILVTGLIAVSLAGGVIWLAAAKRNYAPLYFVLWFAAFLAPVLPFQNRFADYYVVLPATGLALAAGILAGSIEKRPALAAVGALAAGYAGFSFVDARANLDWIGERAERIHRLIDAGVEVSKTKKADTLLLSGVDTELFTTALQDSPFRLYGLEKVYLVPGSETSIRARADLGGVSAYKIALPQAVSLLESGSAVVLSIAGNEIHDATNRYRAVALNQYLQSRPQQVNLGEPGYDTLLGPGWWPLEDKFRWMSKSASVRLGSPAKGVRKKLEVRGFCPESVASRGPVTLTVKAAGSAQSASKTLREVGAFVVALDVEGTGEEWVTVELAVDRVTNLPGDKRQLGVIFGTVLLKP